MLRFIKDWTLPLAMLLGITGYFCLASFDFLAPVRPVAGSLAQTLPPFLIFAQLLLVFCKVDWRDLLPDKWHAWLLLFQALACLAAVGCLLLFPLDAGWRIAFEGMMVCFICPTATAAAVVTGKLGGNAASLTVYTLLSNLLAAIMVPLFFPLVEPSSVSFGAAFFRILGKVFPLLLFPFFIALLLRKFFPVVHRFLTSLKDAAFYLWAVALTIVMGQTARSMVEGNEGFSEELLIDSLSLVICCIQFYVGKRIGSAYHDRISAGQALGQKNSVLAIWMACTYLNPVSAVAPGSYALWQNIINSYQLLKKRR